MFALLNNRKSITIAEEKRLFRSPQFCLRYPKKLNGIIAQDEFQQSITNINTACRPTLCEKILICSLFLCALIGLLMFIAGISVIWLPIAALWIPLMSIGFASFMSFFVAAIIVSSQVYRACDTRLDKAVETESGKYSTRLPIPAKWKLDMTIYARRDSTVVATDTRYFLLIDVGPKPAVKAKNQTLNTKPNLSKSTPYINQQYSTDPPAYPNPPVRRSFSNKTLPITDSAHIHSIV